MLSLSTTLLLTGSYLLQGSVAAKSWGNPNHNDLFAGGWTQVPDDVITVHVTKTQTVCPCDSTGSAGGYPTGSSKSSTSKTSTSSRSNTSTTTRTSTLTTTTTSGTGTTTSATGTTTTPTTSGSGTTTTTSGPGTTTSGTGTTTTTSGTSTTTTTSGTGTTTTTSGATTTTSGTGTTTTTTTSGTGTTTTTSGTGTTTTTTTTSGSPLPTFNFLAFNNPYVTDGTAMGDLFVLSSDRPNNGYANFNNGADGFRVDPNGNLVDSQTGGIAFVVDGLDPAPMRFSTQEYINDPSNPNAANIVPCVCALDSDQNLSCDCNGLTVFGADYRKYLYMLSDTTTKKRSNDIVRRGNALEARQNTDPVSVDISATPAPTTSTTTTTICNLPLQTFNLVSNGSVVTNGSAANVQPVPDGVYVKQTDWNSTEHYQYAGFRNGSLTDPDPGFYGGIFTFDRCTGIVQEATYGRLLCTAPFSSFSEAYFMPLDIIVADSGDLCYCNIDQTTFAFTCTCGPNSIFQNPPSWQLYIGSYARVGGGVVYPIARVIG